MSSHCGPPNDTKGDARRADVVIALAGNANVGKSAVFNQLTGRRQTLGNWPGKTVERAEGFLEHHGKTIKVVDLPGIYSFATYSEEEEVTRDYILSGSADVIVNVIDATALERNLFFTLQLLEMGTPVVAALNLVDQAGKKGMRTDPEKLGDALGIPVVETVAVRGRNVHEVVDAALDLLDEGPGKAQRRALRYSAGVEERVGALERALSSKGFRGPSRWTAVKLLEGDADAAKRAQELEPGLAGAARERASEISRMRGAQVPTVMASERYALAAGIAGKVQTLSAPGRRTNAERLDDLTMHRVWGYVLLLAVMVSILVFISMVGGMVSDLVQRAFEGVNPRWTGFWPELAWNGGVVGLYAALSVGFGFILPFYLILGFLEDSGYLPKVAYLMDAPCHAMGLHGKAAMPMVLAFGCNVPACLGCRIMENRRDRLIAMFLSTLVPCSARTAVILGLVGVFMGWPWAVGLYLFDFAFIFVMGRALNRLLPGESVGLIMEVPPYRTPVPKLVLRQAWDRFSGFLRMSLPLIVVGSVVIEGLRLGGQLETASGVLSPVTVAWLGLPAFTGILLVFGILRKEAALVLLVTVAGTADIASVMTPVQMFVFALVIMLYIPCISTIAALVKEAGWKNAALMTATEIGLATLIGGIAYRVLELLM